MSQSDSLRIEPVYPTQAVDLSALIHCIYPQYFTYLWDDAGAWYLDYAYNSSKLRSELDNPSVRYFWAVWDSRRIGYLKLNLDKALPATQEAGGLEIERIYLLREAAGQGIGTLLINHAEAVARQLHRRYVWLHAMDSSHESMAFYRKRGFEQVGETVLPFEQMKPVYRRMWQLRKQLA
ncbi:GNAT family N-acetyltransferase [Fibrella sp. ES10-3-2-2]|nr:hypothetical protein A6C57_24240 [Fibrella sp. ES10-3-2-2]